MSDTFDTAKYNLTKLKDLCDLMMSHLFQGNYRNSNARFVNLDFTDVVYNAERDNLIRVANTSYGNSNTSYYEISTTLSWLHYAKNINGFTKEEFLRDCSCGRVFDYLKRAGIIVRPKPFAPNYISCYVLEVNQWEDKMTKYFQNKKS